MTKVRVTEYLDLNLQNEQWCCNRCGHELTDARNNYKQGALVAERALEEVHPPLVDGQHYSFTPDPNYCRLLEFYCPTCATLLETEYLPPGHPITHDIELDIDAMKAKYLTKNQGSNAG